MKKVWKIIGNKYVIATLVFAALMLFLDDYSLRVSSRLHKQVKELHDEEQALANAIVEDSINATTLRNSMDAKEHYGREKYYMKKADEDIFVIK